MLPILSGRAPWRQLSPTLSAPHRTLANGGALLRTRDWWPHKVPPLLAVAYLCCDVGKVPAATALPVLGVFLVAVGGTAAFGHVLNDWSDREQDRRAEKPGVVTRLPPWAARALLTGLLLLALLPWLALPHTPAILALVGTELALFALYSLPPLRLKERGGWGALADALYGHAVPIAITTGTFMLLMPAPGAWERALLATLCVFKLAQGLCGALVSQVRDRRADRRAGVRSAALRWGPRRTLAIVITTLLPAQAALFLAVCAVVSLRLRWFAPLYLAFVAATFWKLHLVWRWPLSRYRRSYLGYAYLNNFHQKLMPLALGTALAIHQPAYAPLVLLHAALFAPGLVFTAREWGDAARQWWARRRPAAAARATVRAAVAR